MTPEDIRRFVTGTLGCRCPPSVLARVTSETELADGPAYRTLAVLDPTLPPRVDRIACVGDRLLVLFSRLRDPDLAALLLRSGVDLRDRMDFHRLRLVLLTGDPDDPGLPMPDPPDERVHLHILTSAVI